MSTTTKTLSAAALAQCTGSETWYRHAINRKVFLTDGAKLVADQAGAYGLIDEIAIGQLDARVAAESFQVWKLAVNADQSGVRTCEDGNEHNEVGRAYTGHSPVRPSLTTALRANVANRAAILDVTAIVEPRGPVT